MQLKNRIIMPPMEPNYGSATGEVTEQMINYYAERAKGGVGLIIIHITCVDYPAGKAVSNQISLDNDKYVPGMARLAKAIHNWGAKVVVQLHHAGRQTKKRWTDGLNPVGADSTPCPFMQEAPFNEQPRALSYDEVQGMVDKFIDAAERSAAAGFDGVQIHGAHGYLVGQFMSPAVNKRNDRYGGDFHRRMRFPVEIVTGIRKKLGPDFPVLFRYSADEFYPGGITLEGDEGGIAIGKRMAEAGVDCLNVSCGIYASMTTLLEPMMYNEGWRVYLAERIKQEVSIPVATVGVIRRPEMAEEILTKGQADFIEVGRTLIADPHWPHKARTGRAEEINKCISCNNCIGAKVFFMQEMDCTQNPEVGREGKWAQLKEAIKAKKVMVIGGGPAGMEAARVAHLRGHDVTLWEKESDLGGQLNLAALSPGKEKINWVKEWQTQQISINGVKVVYGKTVDEATIKAENPDVVMVATGAAPFIPDLPGIEGSNVFLYKEVLSKSKEITGSNIVVAGGGMIGCECAWELANRGKSVTVVEMQDDILLDMDPITRAELIYVRLPQARVTWKIKTKIMEINSGGVVVIDGYGNKSFLECDGVVIALGTTSVNKLEAAAYAAGVQDVYVLGDARQPRKIVDAKYDGAWAAREI